MRPIQDAYLTRIHRVQSQGLGNVSNPVVQTDFGSQPRCGASSLHGCSYSTRLYLLVLIVLLLLLGHDKRTNDDRRQHKAQGRRGTHWNGTDAVKHFDERIVGTANGCAHHHE